MKQYLALALMLLVLPMALADGPEIPDGIDPADQEQFDAILQPVMKIYSFVKYISTIVAAIFLLYAGITYMSSGSDPRKRDQAKNTATYVFVGLFVIWAAPLLIGLMA